MTCFIPRQGLIKGILCTANGFEHFVTPGSKCVASNVDISYKFNMSFKSTHHKR